MEAAQSHTEKGMVMMQRLVERMMDFLFF